MTKANAKIAISSMTVKCITALTMLALSVGVFAQAPVSPSPVLQFFDNSGLPAASAKLCSYAAGTTTPQTTYNDPDLAGGHANTNPLTLDSAGRIPAGLYLTATNYKFILYTGGTAATCDGSALWTRDNVPAVSLLTTAAKLGTGSPSATTFLRGDLTWATPTFADYGVCDLRLTLTSGTPVTTADVTAATTVYVSPLKGGRCGFYDGSGTWTVLANAETSFAVPSTTSTMYDVWCRNNSGTIACDTTAWTNDTTRATALTTQNTVYVKTGDTTRRYVGSFRTTTVSGQTEDSVTKRFVWSYYDRVRRGLAVKDTTNTWTYSSTTFQQANNSTANQAAVVVGVAEVMVEAQVAGAATHGSATSTVVVAVGYDSTTTPITTGYMAPGTATTTTFASPTGGARHAPAVGYHFYAWLEAASSATTTWYGDNGVTYIQTGLVGSIEG